MLENMQDIPLQSSHEVGVDALWLEFLNGFVSFIKSIYECQKKGKDHKEAFKCTIKTTLKNGAHSYGIASGGSLLGSIIHNNANKSIQSLGNGSVPTMIVGAGVASCKVLIDYFRGKINESELLKRLGKANTSLVSSLKAREEAKLARQRRIEIEKECLEIIKLLDAYQNHFKEVFEKYFHETTKFFNQSFDDLERALYAGDADLAIAVNNKSREWLGQKALFDNKQEGWELIISNKDIRM
ncbi:hypothetical protein ACLGEC_00560 [Helicobacter pylori]